MQLSELRYILSIGAGDFFHLTGDLAGMVRHEKTANAIYGGSTGQQVIGELVVGPSEGRGRSYPGDPDRTAMTHRFVSSRGKGASRRGPSAAPSPFFRAYSAQRPTFSTSTRPPDSIGRMKAARLDLLLLTQGVQDGVKAEEIEGRRQVARRRRKSDRRRRP